MNKKWKVTITFSKTCRIEYYCENEMQTSEEVYTAFMEPESLYSLLSKGLGLQTKIGFHDVTVELV